jgi:hypothetical protein
MNSNTKLIVGILIGIVGAFAAVAIAYNAEVYPFDSQTSPNSEEANVPISNNTTGTSASTTPKNTTPTNSDANSNLHAGETRVSGEFDIYVDGLAPNVLCFTPDQASTNRFCFKNQVEAKSMLKISSAGTLGPNCEQIRGKATIYYTDYVPNPMLGDTVAGAKLASVAQITQSATCTNTQ